MNMGGGLGVKYIDTDQPPSISSLAEAVTSAMNKYSVNIPTFYIEPGRSIISTAGVTLYRVGSSKEVPNGRKYVAVDGGIICVFNTGAYNYSMASNYNRVEKPAMVLVNNSHSDIIVYRETLDNLIAKDSIPDRLRKQ